MARPLRIDVAGGWYHVTTRGTERKAIFGGEETYRRYLELLEEMSERYGVRVHAYVLMPNHVHGVLETPEANLSAAMQWLKTSYAMWFNRRHGRVGPLFQGRFKAVLFEGRSEAWAVTRYVHLNPIHVQALESSKRQQKEEALGLRPVPPEVLKRRARALRDFRWSSYGAYAGWAPTPAWLQIKAVLAHDHAKALAGQRKAYRTYVEGALGQELEESPLSRAIEGVLLGSSPWVEKVRKGLSGFAREQTAYRHLARPDWGIIQAAVERVKGEAWESFRDRHGDWGRDLAIYVARRHGGMSLREIGERVGVENYYAVSQAVQRMARRLEREAELRKVTNEMVKCMII